MRNKTPYQYHSYTGAPQGGKPPRRSRGPRGRSKKLLILLVVLLLGFGIYHFFIDSNDASSKSTEKTENTVSAASVNDLSAQQQAAMASQINKAIAAAPDLQVGVAVVNLNSGKKYHYGLNVPFVAASTAKLLTASLYLHEVEAGQRSLTTTIGGHTAQYELQQMIELSDDTAWANLNGVLTHPALKAYATSLGLTSYDPDQNTLTANDISIVLTKLYNHQLLNDTNRQLLLGYMKDANFTSYIPAYVPAGVTVYHKAGWLNDRVHDSAIIDNGKHPYVLVIFTKAPSGDFPVDEGHKLFAAITHATTAQFL